jgi:NADH-quinone oxidoreductase subunit M
MTKMGGLWTNMPRMGACAMFFAVASLGLPGLGNFVAEFLILLGLFAASPWVATIAALGLITAAVYALWMMQLTFQGSAKSYSPALHDFGGREMTTMAGMIIALIWLGLYPQPIFDLVTPVLDNLQQLATVSSYTIAGVSQ